MAENLNERTGTETLDFEDRRRLVCEELVMTAERNQGGVFPAQFGETILRWTASTEEVVAMGDRALTVLSKRMQRGL